MDSAVIFALLEKGLALLPSLIEAGINVKNTIERLRAVAAAKAAGQDVSQADVDALEAELDGNLAEFNKPMDPPAGG